jgi:acid stress chaperone HdeB
MAACAFSFRLRRQSGKRAGAAFGNLLVPRCFQHESPALPKEIAMKTAASILFAALLLAAPVPANAVVLDLSTMSCKQFLDSGDDTIKLVLTWMDGWYKGDSDEAIIDTNVFVENAKKFGAYCATNPTVSIVNAAEAILGK